MTLLIGHRVYDLRDPTRRGESLGLSTYWARVRFDGEGLRPISRYNLRRVRDFNLTLRRTT
jgi:hypothetical protein